MPISGGKYVAPTWANSTTPPIDASELQDICDSIESYADPVTVVPTISNPNLLDNWYFVGGGSQQGGGQFPINSRGQTSYSGSTDAIDRWYGNGSGVSVVISTNCVTFSTTTSTHAFQQRVSKASRDILAGQTVTFSVLTGAVSGGIRISDAGNLAVSHADVNVSANSVTSYTFTVNSSASSTNAAVMIWGSSNASAELIAAKLELGSTQTLAHQENGTWVLNEIPNYDIQFARCSELPSVPGRYETGTYTGTGTTGSSNPTSLTFGFVPRIVMIREATASQRCMFDAVYGCSSIRVDTSNSGGTVTLTWSGTTLSWYGSSATWQMNYSGDTYYYTAIG